MNAAVSPLETSGSGHENCVLCLSSVCEEEELKTNDPLSWGGGGPWGGSRRDWGKVKVEGCRGQTGWGPPGSRVSSKGLVVQPDCCSCQRLLPQNNLRTRPFLPFITKNTKNTYTHVPPANAPVEQIYTNDVKKHNFSSLQLVKPSFLSVLLSVCFLSKMSFLHLALKTDYLWRPLGGGFVAPRSCGGGGVSSARRRIRGNGERQLCRVLFQRRDVSRSAE